MFEHGPCAQWVSRAELQSHCPDCVGTTVDELATAQACIDEASEQLYILTGRQFPGTCERTVSWCNPSSCGVTCCSTCNTVPRIPLTGPNIEITTVTYDGVLIPGTDYLVMDDAWLIPANGALWPSSHTNLDSTVSIGDQFEIVYSFGAPPPLAAKRACKDLACQMIMALRQDAACRLSNGAVTASALGSTVTIDPEKILAAGIGSVRALMELVNPLNQRLPSVTWSPDLDPGLHTLL